MDESKFNLRGNHYSGGVWCRVGEEYNLQYLGTTAKYLGGIIIVYICTTATRVGKLEFIDEMAASWQNL